MCVCVCLQWVLACMYINSPVYTQARLSIHTSMCMHQYVYKHAYNTCVFDDVV